jgi:hypothetical protein
MSESLSQNSTLRAQAGPSILLDQFFPWLPPSVNSMYATGGNRGRFKVETASTLARAMAALITRHHAGFLIPMHRGYLEFFIVCYYPRPRQAEFTSDSDGRLKAAKDIVFAASQPLGEPVLKRVRVKRKSKLLDTSGYTNRVVQTLADDKIVNADHTDRRFLSSRGQFNFPQGCCRVVLAYVGHTTEILELLQTDPVEIEEGFDQ